MGPRSKWGVDAEASDRHNWGENADRPNSIRRARDDCAN